MYLNPALFSVEVSTNHLLRALAHEEPYYHDGVTLSRVVRSDNFYGTTMAKLETDWNRRQWLELPYYLPSWAHGKNPLLVKGMVGIRNQLIALVDTIDPPDPMPSQVQRFFWLDGIGAAGAATIVEWYKEPEKNRLAKIETIITWISGGQIILERHYQEWSFGGKLALDWKIVVEVKIDGSFREISNKILQGEISSEIQKPPVEFLAIQKLRGELYQAMCAARDAINDLPRVAEIAMSYNLPVTRDWLP